MHCNLVLFVHVSNGNFRYLEMMTSQFFFKVMLVIDDRDVRHIVSQVEIVKSAVAAVGHVDETNQLVPCFKVR